MSEVKERHRCEQCEHFDKARWVCWEHTDADNPPEKWVSVDPDLEACSDFEPRGGWRE